MNEAEKDLALKVVRNIAIFAAVKVGIIIAINKAAKRLAKSSP